MGMRGGESGSFLAQEMPTSRHAPAGMII
jgi:hypothetical protein